MVLSVVLNEQHWSASLHILPISCPLFFVSLSLLSFQLCGWMLLLVVLLFWWTPQILLQSLFFPLCSLIHQCRLPCYYCDKRQHLIHRETKYTARQRRLKLQRKWKVNKTYKSVPKKTGTKIYGRTGDEPDTATPMAGKWHIILLWKRNTHREWQWDKAILLTTQRKNL